MLVIVYMFCLRLGRTNTSRRQIVAPIVTEQWYWF